MTKLGRVDTIKLLGVLERGREMLLKEYAMTRAASLILVLAAAFSSSALAADEVVDTRGQTYRGRVMQDDINGVNLRLEGGEGRVQLRLEEVAKVRYGHEPFSYQYGEAALKRGDCNQALVNFETALDERRLRRNLKQYVLFKIATCHQRLGNYKEATQTLEKLLKDVPKTRFLLETLQRLISAYSQTGDVKKVGPLIDDFARFRPQEAALLKAQFYERVGKIRQAQRLYERLRNAGGSIGARATIGLARILVRKRPAKARRQVEALIQGDRKLDDAVYTQAHLLIGGARFQMARKKDDYRDALLAYLRVVLLYAGDEQAEPEALFMIGQCFEKLEDKTSKRRAAKWYSRAAERYGNTSWGKKAQERLPYVRR